MGTWVEIQVPSWTVTCSFGMKDRRLGLLDEMAIIQTIGLILGFVLMDNLKGSSSVCLPNEKQLFRLDKCETIATNAMKN